MREVPQVDFRSGIQDPLAYAGVWLRKAYAQRARVRVIGPAVALSALSQQLWVADKEGFLPHALAGVDPKRPGIGRTAIWLGTGPVAGNPPSLLLNLGSPVPDDWATYRRIVEIVGADEERVQAGRDRWAGYRRLGLEPRHRTGASDDPAVP